MQLQGHYVANSADDSFYDVQSYVTEYDINQSLAGKVWSSKSECLWDIDDNTEYFTRVAAANKIGLQAIMGLPLLFNDEVIGVLKIGTKKRGIDLTKHSKLFKRLEIFVGSEISRKKLENDLMRLFDVIPDIICLLDFKGKFLKINKAGSDILGYKAADLLHQEVTSFIHPSDINDYFKEISNLEERGNSAQFENRFVAKNGDVIWLSWNCIAVAEEGLIYATAKNSTVEYKIKELTRQAGKLAKIGSWELDVLKSSVFWSPEVYSLHEIDPGTFTPSLESGISFYRQDFLDLVTKCSTSCLTDGTPFDFEAVIITAKKKEVWVRCMGEAEFVDGKCKRMYGSFQDIDSLKATQNRLQSLSENLPGVIYQYTIYPNGTDAIDHILGAVEQLWGYTVKEIKANINLLWEEIKLGGDIEEVQKTIINSIQTKTKWTCRFRVVLPNGKLKTHLGNGTPIFLANGNIIFNVIVLDISQEAKNEDLLAQASKISRIGSWEMDLINPETGAMYWSPMIKEIVGVDKNYNPTLTSALEFCVGASKEHLDSAAHDLIHYGKEYDEEFIIKTIQKQEKWIRIIGKTEKVNKKLIRIYGSFQDITAAKKIEQQKNKLQTTLEKSLNEIFIFDCTTLQFTYANRGALLNIGYKEHEIKNLNVIDIKPDFTETSFRALITPLLNNTKEKIIFFTNHKRKNGSLYPAEIHLQLVKEGNVKQFLAITLDITERKKAQENLMQSNERFEKVTEATNDIIWDWNLEKKTYYRSKASEKLFGANAFGLFSESELWSSDYLHQDDLKQVNNSLKQAIANPKIMRWQQEYRVINEKGGTIYVIDQAVIMRDLSSNVTRIVGAMTDITNQKQMTLELNELNKTLQKHTFELERSNEELEQFAFVASHDLQEPLRMIASFMELLERKYGNLLDDKGHQYIHFAVDGAKRMKQIILDLLEYSRANKSNDGIELVDVNEAFFEFLQLRRKIIAEKGAVITASELPHLLTYKAAITQILHCLLDNALKYTIEDVAPIIRIDFEEQEKEWICAINDNDIGIDPQFFSKIFVIFQRLHNKENYPGTELDFLLLKEILKH